MNEKFEPINKYRDIRVLLICREGSARQRYLDSLKHTGVRIDVVSSYEELYKKMSETGYNGVMIDLITKIRNFKNNKEAVHSILDKYPVIQLRFEQNTGEIAAFYFGQVRGGGSLEDFITRQCGSCLSRKIRSIDKRSDMIFNILISRNNDLDKFERTITMNMSPGGCFVFSTGNWKLGENIWFVIKELSDHTPMHGIVRWTVKWGESMQVPGIGVEFLEIKPVQIEEINGIL